MGVKKVRKSILRKSRWFTYAQWCADDDNNKVGVYVRKQCKKWLDIVNGKDSEAYLDSTALEKTMNLLRLIVHPDLHCSMAEGLEDYALLLIVAVFCTKDSKTHARYYETVLLEIARKNFKTFTSAVIFIIGLLISNPFSRLFSVAPDYKLSKELWTAVRKIIKSSPCLLRHFKVTRDCIYCKVTDSDYTPLAYSTDSLDGRQANIFLADEAGALDDYPVEAMRSSQILLADRLGIIISTIYPNDNNAMITEIDYAKKCLDDLISDRKYFALLYEPDSVIQKQWKTNDTVIYQSNPVSVTHKDVFESILKRREMAILYENKRENFLCKHCNIPYKGLGVEGFVDVLKVRACKQVENLDFWRGRMVWLGLDFSQTDDNTSVAMATEENGIIYAKVWGFVPADKVEWKTKKEKVDYKKLIEQGVCFACGDDVIDYEFVENFILNIEGKYGVTVASLGFDRYNALSSVQKLESADNPIECVEIKQHSSLLHRPTKLLYEKILSGNFRYDENLMLEINFQNARCTEDTNLNKYVNKKKSAGKVDMVVSLINALYLLDTENLDSGMQWGVAY